MMGRYVRSTSVEDQREFVEHLQIGKQIGKLLDMPKRTQPPKPIFQGGVKYNSLNSILTLISKTGLIQKMQIAEIVLTV